MIIIYNPFTLNILSEARNKDYSLFIFAFAHSPFSLHPLQIPEVLLHSFVLKQALCMLCNEDF
jgi:hypothetical protein